MIGIQHRHLGDEDAPKLSALLCNPESARSQLLRTAILTCGECRRLYREVRDLLHEGWLDRSFRHLDLAAARSRKAARILWPDVESMAVEDLERKLVGNGGFARWGVVEKLCEESYRLATVAPERSVALASAAVAFVRGPLADQRHLLQNPDRSLAKVAHAAKDLEFLAEAHRRFAESQRGGRKGTREEPAGCMLNSIAAFPTYRSAVAILQAVLAFEDRDWAQARRQLATAQSLLEGGGTALHRRLKSRALIYQSTLPAGYRDEDAFSLLEQAATVSGRLDPPSLALSLLEDGYVADVQRILPIIETWMEHAEEPCAAPFLAALQGLTALHCGSYRRAKASLDRSLRGFAAAGFPDWASWIALHLMTIYGQERRQAEVQAMMDVLHDQVRIAKESRPFLSLLVKLLQQGASPKSVSVYASALRGMLERPTATSALSAWRAYG